MTAETFLPFKTPKMCLTPQFMELQSNDLGRLNLQPLGLIRNSRRSMHCVASLARSQPESPHAQDSEIVTAPSASFPRPLAPSTTFEHSENHPRIASSRGLYHFNARRRLLRGGSRGGSARRFRGHVDWSILARELPEDGRHEALPWCSGRCTCADTGGAPWRRMLVFCRATRSLW